MRRFNIKFRRTMTALSIVGLAIGYVLIIALNNILYEDTISLRFMLYCTAAGAPFIILAGLCVQWLVRISGEWWWTNKYPTLRYVFLITTVSITTIGLTTVGFAFFDPNENDSLWQLMGRRYYIISIPAVLILGLLILIVALYDNVVDHTRAQEKKLEEAELRLTQMRYQQLKAQVNPHFLFNSLNILSSLINIDPKQAVNYTKELAAIYRYLLSHDEEGVSTLKEELTFSQQYSGIMMMRYNKGLAINIPNVTDVSIATQRVLPTTVQLLIENACKHNLVSEENPLAINIYVENSHIVVSNNRIPRPTPADSTGLGLKGLCRKYEILAHKRVIIEVNPERFTVKVPLITPAEAGALFISAE